MFYRNNHNLKGMTLVELMIALGIFCIVITMATSIFVRLLKTSQFVKEKMTAIDNLSLATEQIAREVRTGKSFAQVSSSFNTSKELRFINYLGESVVYSFNENHRLEKNGIPITSGDLKIDGNFIITNPTTPRVVVSMTARNKRDVVLTRAETTIGARLIYYRE